MSKKLIDFEVRLGCGCCTGILSFNSVEDIQEAFKKVGYTSSGVITDAEGYTLKSIDTFYGFWLANVEDDE